MKPTSDLTYKILVHSEIPDFKTDDCIDWAIDMLKLGYDTENLRILAGISKHTYHDEIDQYLKATLTELGPTEIQGDEGIQIYCTCLVKNIIKGTKIKESLRDIYECCIANDMERSIFDFWLLYWAWQDLDYGMEYQRYWDGADKNNIEQIVVETAKKATTLADKLIISSANQTKLPYPQCPTHTIPAGSCYTA